jgi:hypothetical protein
MPAFFMEQNFQQFFNDALIARLWQMARPSSSSGGEPFDEIVRP